ncbi:MAG: hypothetical protein ACKOJC_05755 [Actinomycetota bacterium]
MGQRAGDALTHFASTHDENRESFDTTEAVESTMAQRNGRPLFVIDIAVPRDVDAAVGDIDGVTLMDIDDHRDWAARGQELRAAEAAAVRGIVTEEVERYVIESTARQAAPLIAQLHERAEAVRAAEVLRHRGKMESLDDDQRAVVESVTRGIVAKLLHDLSVRLKDDAGTPRGERNAAAVRDLFDLH